MDKVWMLDYLNAVFPRWGVFESEQTAWDWVAEHDPTRTAFYQPFSLTINRDSSSVVPTTAPQSRYANQR